MYILGFLTDFPDELIFKLSALEHWLVLTCKLFTVSYASLVNFLQNPSEFQKRCQNNKFEVFGSF